MQRTCAEANSAILLSHILGFYECRAAGGMGWLWRVHPALGDEDLVPSLVPRSAASQLPLMPAPGKSKVVFWTLGICTHTCSTPQPYIIYIFENENRNSGICNKTLDIGIMNQVLKKSSLKWKMNVLSHTQALSSRYQFRFHDGLA